MALQVDLSNDMLVARLFGDGGWDSMKQPLMAQVCVCSNREWREVALACICTCIHPSGIGPTTTLCG